MKETKLSTTKSPGHWRCTITTAIVSPWYYISPLKETWPGARWTLRQGFSNAQRRLQKLREGPTINCNFLTGCRSPSLCATLEISPNAKRTIVTMRCLFATVLVDGNEGQEFSAWGFTLHTSFVDLLCWSFTWFYVLFWCLRWEVTLLSLNIYLITHSKKTYWRIWQTKDREICFRPTAV